MAALTEFSAVTGNLEQTENKVYFILSSHQVFGLKAKTLLYVNPTTPIDKVGHVVASLKGSRGSVCLHRHVSVQVDHGEDQVCQGDGKVGIVLFPFTSSSEN